MSKISDPKHSFVSSEHLRGNEGAELSELEFGLILASNAFNRWIVKCMSAAGEHDLSSLDVLVLHNIKHRDRPKRLSDIAFTLNIEDNHTIGYSLRKLQKLGLLTTEKRGKEVFYSPSKKGADLVEKYRQIREECLISSLSATSQSAEDLRKIGQSLRVLSGLYDQASRAASSL